MKLPVNININFCEDVEFLADTNMEYFEGLYVKLHEMIKFLISKGADTESLFIIVPPYVADRFVHNATIEKGRQFVGWLISKWKVYQDDRLSKDKIEIESNIGKIDFTVIGFSEKVGEK